MKAIVLTCDKYVNLTDHMIQTYLQRWPTNLFTFRIPYQRYPEFLRKKYGDRVELVRTPRDIKATVLSLLNDLQDDYWIYWCIDDKYLVKIDEDAANNVCNWISGKLDPSVASVSFCRCRGSATPDGVFPDVEIVTSLGQKFLQKRAQFEFWIHHFTKVKTVRDVFLSFPDEPFAAKQMDDFMMGLHYFRQRASAVEKEILKNTERWLVLEKNAAVFGESTMRGDLTANCAESHRQLGMELPQGFTVIENTGLMGNLG